MTDIFSGEVQNTDTPPVNDLTAWVGEGKKYANAEEALKALPHSQSHIETLEEENRKLREQVGTLEKQVEEPTQKAPSREDEILAEVRKLSAPTVSTKETPELNEEALVSIVDQRVAEREAMQRAAANRAQAQAKLVEQFGDSTKAAAAVAAKAQELGVNPEFLSSLAEQSPQALLVYFTNQVGSEPKPNPTPQGSGGPQGDDTIQPGTKRYYDKMRREDPARYNSAEILLERQKNLTEKGAAYYE